MNRYHFGVGNSTHGPVGYCAAIYAESPEDALEVLRGMLEGDGVLGHLIDDPDARENGGIDYLNVYFNPEKVTLEDIDEN